MTADSSSSHFVAGGPSVAASSSETHWFHRPLPGGVPLRTLAQTGSPWAYTLAEWLCEAAGRYRVQVRLAARGHHAGVWLGLMALGATPRDATDAGQRGREIVRQGLVEFGWPVEPARAPRLPRAWRGLRLESAGPVGTHVALLPELADALQLVARPGSPMVLVWSFDLSRARPGVVRDGQAMRRLLAARLESVGEGDGLPALLQSYGSCLETLDQAVDAQVSVQVHAHRLPGEVPLRMLATQVGMAHGVVARWGRGAEPLSAAYHVLPRVLDLLAARPRQGPRRYEDDDIPF